MTQQELRDGRESKLRITTTVIPDLKKKEGYIVYVTYIDTDQKGIVNFKSILEVEEYIGITKKYIELLKKDHNNWCNIEASMVKKVAKMIGIYDLKEREEDYFFDFFLPHPSYGDYMARPNGYMVTYTNNGVEFKCEEI